VSESLAKFGVVRNEMSTASEENAGSVRKDVDASNEAIIQGADQDGRTTPRPGIEPAPTDRLKVGTDEVSGIRSVSAEGSVSAKPAKPRPTSSALRKLSRDVEDDATIMEQFVSDYLGLLDHRLVTLRRLLANTDEDPEAAIVAILSLETTSAMIGAGEVVVGAQALRSAVKHQRRDRATVLFDGLLAAVQAMRESLTTQGFRD
jgi:hypothetical protein